MSSLSTLPKGDSAWLLRKSIQRIMQQVSVLETNIGSSTTGNSANTQVIFNDNGTLRGDTGLTFNKTTDLLTVGAATITGDLTVDTSTLKVDSANNRVGIGTASPATILDIQSAGGVFARIQNTASSADAYLLVKNTVGEGFFGINATGPYIYTAGSLPITFTTATSERYRIASDGVATWSNVGGVAGTAMTLNSTGLGVGVSPSARFHSKAGAVTQGGIIETSGANALLSFADAGTSSYTRVQIGSSGNNLAAFINSVQAMTLDASGNLLVGTTSSLPSFANGRIEVLSEASSYCMVADATATSAAGIGVRGNDSTVAASFYNASTGGTVGSIVINSGGVSYNTTSDYRLKESIKPISGGLARVNALKPSIYNWKSNGSSGEGFLAHELAEVVPFAVTGEKDAVNEDGSIKAQSIDMSRVVPILVAAIQELTAEVNALKNA